MDGQRSRSLRIDAKVTRVTAGSGAGAGAGSHLGSCTRPGEAKGDPDEKENDDSGVSGGSSVIASLSLSQRPPVKVGQNKAVGRNRNTTPVSGFKSPVHLLPLDELLRL